MGARAIVRLADEDSRIGLVNEVHSLASSLVGDVQAALERVERVRALDPTLFASTDVTAALNAVRNAQHGLVEAVSLSWETALTTPNGETR